MSKKRKGTGQHQPAKPKGSAVGRKRKHAPNRYEVTCDDPFCVDHNWSVIAVSPESALSKCVDLADYEPLTLRAVGERRVRKTFPISNGGHPIEVSRVRW